MSGHLTEPGGQSQDSARVNRGTLTELRGRRNPHRVVQLEIAFLGFLALAIYCGRDLLT